MINKEENDTDARFVWGTIVKLTAVSAHGKNRINQFGELWFALRTMEAINSVMVVPCKNAKLITDDGPIHMEIESSLADAGARWVEIQHDKHFNIDMEFLQSPIRTLFKR